MSFWLELNQDPDSKFGFETFEGLPENWKSFGGVVPKGTFSVDGTLPAIPDPRIRFFKGCSRLLCRISWRGSA